MGLLNAKDRWDIPTYSLSEEEFTDPIKFIQQIYQFVSQYGICKIRPPNSWKPPFAVNDMKFTFTPRIQKLSDVSASNRERNNFISSLVNFWELQNVVVYDQYVKGKRLDLFSLYKSVKQLCGYDNVCKNNNWKDICQKLGFDTYPAIASSISSKYRKILLPFEKFDSAKSKMNFVCDNAQNDKSVDEKTNYFACKKCNKVDKPDLMLICAECCCNGVYHTYCLDMPLSYVPKSWLCPKCFMTQFNKKNGDGEYGFRSSHNTYTLRKFSNMAFNFKRSFFSKPLTTISLAEVREEFWKLVGEEDCEVTVEYGADLHSSKTGSGFPTNSNSKRVHEYCSSPWNLNNFAKNPLSALRYLPNDISGMKVPWCYVGMVFSCFCWHTEDHWSFSINYLHEGEPKTWYAVPAAYADAFERAMQAEASELFAKSPDLLHHMTTMVPPERLRALGVPVYTTDQLAGEFVVTFPRAYHAGFNNGYNFAEAVNFCPAEWFPFGFDCVDHYALLHRPPVFSHAKLLCRLAQDSSLDSSDGDSKDQRLAPITFLLSAAEQFTALLAKERTLRSHLLHEGVRHTIRRIPQQSGGSLSSMDEEASQECQLCKTTLFTSALTCSCSKTMLCLEHYQSCTCCPPDKQILIYRYDLDELKQISQRPQARIREYQEWKARVDEFLCMASSPPKVEIKKEAVEKNSKEKIEKETANENVDQSTPPDANIIIEPITIKDEPDEIPSVSRISLQELTDLRDKGVRNVYPDNLIDALSAVITEVEEYATTARSICHLKQDEKEASGDTKSSSSFTDSSSSKQLKSSPKKFKKESPEWSLQDIVQPDLPLNSDLAKACSSISYILLLYVVPLSLREFELFVEKVNKLPCEFPEMEELNLLKRRIEEWQVSALEVLTLSSQIVRSEKEEDSELARPLPPLPELQRVKDLVNFGRSIEVDLKPLLSLRYVLECLSWLNTVESIMNLPDSETSSEEGHGYDERPTLKHLLDTEARGQRLTFYLRNYAAEDMKGGTAQQDDSNVGTTIALELAVSRYNSRLLAAINATQILEAGMKKFLNASHGSCHLLEAEKLVERRGNVLGTFSAAEQLSAMCTKARSIMDHLNAFQRIIELNRIHRERSTEADMHPGYATRKPSRADARIKLPEEFVQRTKLNTPESTPKLWLEFYNELCRGAKRLPFIFPDTSRIKKMLIAANRCYERLKTAFMPFEDESEFDVERFLEAVLPRPKSALAILIYRDIEHLPNAQSVAPNPDDCSSQAYTEACRRNVTEFMEQLNTGRSFDNLYDNVYSSMIDDELRMLYCLRKINNRKSKHRDQDSVIYCVCRQPGYSGFMLQCELCRDWFHKRCVNFSSKNVDVSRLRYVCPHCERTNRPELAEVILILKELVPHFLGQEDEDNEDIPPYRLGDWSKSFENIGSELISALSSIPLLLKFPLLTAVHLACERAFIFASRAKDVIDKQRELWELLREYEAFSGVKIQWQNYNETAILAAPRSNRQQHHQQRSQAVGSSLSRSHLPPNVTRPPGMQPLVLRTSAPRSLVAPEERLQQLRHQQQQQFGEKLHQQSINRNQQQINYENNKPDDLETSEFRKEQNEKEAAVALAIMSSAEPSAASQAKSPPFTSSEAGPPYISNQVRSRIPSGEVNRRELETDFHRSPPHFRMPNTAGGASSSFMPSRSLSQPSTFRYSIHPEARYCLNNLLGEACALEMSMPQTRWLWQMNLAVDPDCEGALHPRIICAEETAMRRRSDRKRPGGSVVGVGAGNGETISRYQRPRRQNCVVASSERPFYATLAHKGREGLKSYEYFPVKRRLSSSSRVEPITSQRRRGKSGLRGAMTLSLRRGLSTKLARMSERQIKEEQKSDPEKQEEDEMEEEAMRQADSPSFSSTVCKPRCGRISREQERELSSHSEEEETGGSSSHCRVFPALRSSSDPRCRRGAVTKHTRDFRSLVKAAQRDVAAARRFAVSHRRRGSASRGRGGAGRPRGSLSRQLYQKQYQQRRKSRQEAINKEEEYEEELCEAPGGCERPSGNVSWVACDQCDSWYHQRCVGIMNTREVPDVYVCNNCQANNTATRREALKSQKFRTARGGRWKKMCDAEMYLSDFEVEEEVDENGPPASPKRPRVCSPEPVPSTSRPAVNVESAGAEALLAAIEVLDAIPRSIETADVAKTENVINDNPPSSHQPKSDEESELLMFE